MSAGVGRGARPLASAVAVLALLFVVGVAAAFSNPEETLAYGASPLLAAALTTPMLAAGTAGVLVHAAQARRRRYWGPFGRLHYTLVAISALAFVALLAYYNLIGFRF